MNRSLIPGHRPRNSVQSINFFLGLCHPYLHLDENRENKESRTRIEKKERENRPPEQGTSIEKVPLFGSVDQPEI